MSLLDSFKMSPEKKAKYEARKAEIHQKNLENRTKMNAKWKTSEEPKPVTPENLIVTLKDRGEKLLTENISADEKILVKLQGDDGQALVLTDKQLYIIKWGFMTNQTFGGKCIAYSYRNITALEVRKKMVMRYVQILTPATQSNVKSSVWEKDNNGDNAKASDNIVTYHEFKDDLLFQEAIQLGRKLMNQSHGATNTVPNQADSINQLEKLAELKSKGIITQEEFDAKKKQILGL